MILTTKGRYAVMSIIDIATSGDSRPVSLADISARQNIPLSYLEQIFMKLRTSGIVTSVRGPGGGYLLSTTPSKISIFRILQAVGEDIYSKGCLKFRGKCNRSFQKCNSHDLWAGLDKKIQEYFTTISIGDVVSGAIFDGDS
ncbi:MAG: Rrf2 family transcriptional regulator [Rickettsiaceae bacterium]|nr:Rrf2 family transcriptional regulator [Rickettsiaceae bacterium]